MARVRRRRIVLNPLNGRFQLVSEEETTFIPEKICSNMTIPQDKQLAVFDQGLKVETGFTLTLRGTLVLRR